MSDPIQTTARPCPYEGTACQQGCSKGECEIQKDYAGEEAYRRYQTTGRCCGSPFNCGAHDPARYRDGCIWPRPVAQTTLGDVRGALWAAIHSAAPLDAVQVTETLGAVLDALENLHLLVGIPDGDATHVA